MDNIIWAKLTGIKTDYQKKKIKLLKIIKKTKEEKETKKIFRAYEDYSKVRTYLINIFKKDKLLLDMLNFHNNTFENADKSDIHMIGIN